MPSLLTFVTLVVALLASTSTVKSQSQLSEATTKFSIDFLRQVFKDQPGNVISSPVSLSTLLAILLQGAAGNTKTELVNALYMNPQEAEDAFSKLITDYKSSTDNATLEFANCFFLDDDLKLLDSFKSIVENKFKSQTYSLDFSKKQEAADTINEWASRNTHGLISELFKPEAITPETIFVLTNAIYFKSSWTTRFNKDKTRQLPFFTQDGGQVQVDTMNAKASYKTGIISDLQSQWIEIPYEGSQYSFLIVMPTDVSGFDNLQNSFSAQNFLNIVQELKSGFAPEVILYMPKFTLTSDLSDLVETLKKLGLAYIFSDYSELPGITGDALKVDKVIQKAKLIVDEEGSEAAAVSAIFGAQVESLAIPWTFKVDRPFLYFIIDKFNSIPLFAGRVVDPSK